MRFCREAVFCEMLSSLLYLGGGTPITESTLILRLLKRNTQITFVENNEQKVVTLIKKFIPRPGPGQVGPVCAGTPTLEMQVRNKNWTRKK
jgi:hypothetical protein